MTVGLGVVGNQDHGVRREEVVDAAAGLDQLAEAAVGVGDRCRGLVGAVAVGVVVVVGEAKEEEVVGVVGDELACETQAEYSSRVPGRARVGLHGTGREPKSSP